MKQPLFLRITPPAVHNAKTLIGWSVACAMMGLASVNELSADELIVSDNFNVAAVGNGFALDKGLNTGINPPKTRLRGSAAAGLRYMQSEDNRPADSYDIERDRMRVKMGAKITRCTLSANGRTPFDFGPVLRTDHASKTKKIVYDVAVSMRNDATTAARLSFGITTMEGEINKMDFALQIYRAKPSDTFYTLQKRFDRGSFNGATTPNSDGDLNEVMTTTAPGTAGTMIPFLIRVTDAGAEGAFVYNSRLQISIDHGSTWIYDTAGDPSLPNGFRLDGTSRHFIFDQAPNMSGPVFYDDFSVTLISNP